MDWFLYDNGLRHERVKGKFLILHRITRCVSSPNGICRMNPLSANLKNGLTIENQLTEFRKKQQETFTKIKKPHLSPKSN